MIAFGRGPVTLAKWCVAAMLLFVQMHLCAGEYVLPGGQTCFTCPALDQTDHQSTIGTTSDVHGDCHDCCELRPCDHEGKDKATILKAPSLTIAMAMPEPVETIEFVTLDEPVAEFEFLEGCPPTGPPSDSRSRAPPSSSNA